MNLQDANRKLDAVSGSAEMSGCETKEELPGQSNESSEILVTRRANFRLKLLRKLEEGHLGSARLKTR